MDNLAVADMLGWPSDFHAWGRLIDWIISKADAVPVRLIPKVLEVFDVWQNVFSDHKNGRSKAILQLANAWLVRFEKGELHDESSGNEGKALRFSHEESSRLGKSLRSILLRSARSYPDFAKELFTRTITDEDRRRAVYADLIAFSPIMTQVDPELVADLAEAESEIAGGYHVEYSGMKFGLFYAAELINCVAISAIIATVFLGGWWLYKIDEIVPGWMIFIGKVYAVYFLFVWTRGTLPRFRIDQLLAFAWKWMTPMAFLNIVLVAAEVLVWNESGWSAGFVLPVICTPEELMEA